MKFKVPVNSKIHHPLDQAVDEIRIGAQKLLDGSINHEEFKLIMNFYFEYEFNYRHQACNGNGCEDCGFAGYLDTVSKDNTVTCSVCGNANTGNGHSLECRAIHNVSNLDRLDNNKWRY